MLVLHTLYEFGYQAFSSACTDALIGCASSRPNCLLTRWWVSSGAITRMQLAALAIVVLGMPDCVAARSRDVCIA